MKTIKLLNFLWLLLAGLAAGAQCTASFIAQARPGDVVLITNTTPSDSLPYDTGALYTWNFGDGSAAFTQTNPQFAHQYSADGSYNVCVALFNSARGCRDTVCQMVTVSYCAGTSAYNPYIVGFGVDSFSIATTPLAGITYAWSFGDGGVDTGTTAVHTYTANGDYNQCLIASNAAHGCADTTCNGIVESLCTFYEGINDSVISLYPPASFIFTPQFPNASYSYSWNFGDGNSATGESVSNTFNVSGIYDTVQLIVSDSHTGCSDTVIRDIYLPGCNLPAQFNASSNGLNAYFAISAYTDSLGLDTGFTGTLNWSFPGASPSTATGNYINVTYSALGVHNACLLAYASSGCTDTICQSFTLTPPVYSISGTIDAGGSSSCGIIYLIKQDTAGHLILLDSVVNSPIHDSTSYTCYDNYNFGSLPVDTYYVKAAKDTGDPDYANYLPTYYGDVLHWADATPVYLTVGDAVANIDLIAGSNPGGPGFVAGWVSEGAGLLPNGQVNNTTRGEGQHLPYVQINLLTQSGQPVAYTYSDSLGHYEISNLAYGTYQIYAEQLNKTAVPDTFTLSTQNPSAALSFIINSNSAVATGITETGNVFINNVYPNPVSSQLQMQVTCKQSTDGVLKLTDELGRVIMQRNVGLASGINTNTVDMESFAVGVYELTLQTEAGSATFKVVKTR